MRAPFPVSCVAEPSSAGAIAEAPSPLRAWLLLRSADGTLPGLPGNLRRAFEDDDSSRLPVFMAHLWQDHLREVAAQGLREAAQFEQREQEVAFHRLLGLDGGGDASLALQLGRAVDRSLRACRCALHLIAQPMDDGSRRFRLELRDGPAEGLPTTGVSDGPQDTLKVIALASREEAAAITTAVHQVLEALGCLADAEQGLFQLEGPQLVALVAILQKLAEPHGCPEALSA